MLQRAASNAYSWWWASHVRTKQSKWLEQSLQDMEEKVQCMLKIIDDDGDSFAKRAEMYYKRRPELINFVEESFRAYRSLAERYEHIAGELQTANQTIATVFPEHAQIAMEDEDEDVPPKKSTGSSNHRKPTKELPEAPPNIPKFTLISKPTRSSTTKPEPKKTAKPTKTSNKSNSEALAEIDKLQKGILVLQTEKEFIKGSYENGLAKYWEIEKQIAEMQKQVCSLQEEFGVGTVIEDDEARTLMAATALKSCKETLIQLQEKHEKSNEEARVENQRIQDICKQLESLKDEYLHNHKDQHKFDKENSEAKVPSLTKAQEGIGKSKEEMHDLESICHMIRKNFANNSNQPLAVAELAETIDQLVTKVMNLETLVSSQAALIERLRSETNELHIKVRTLEHDKETLIEGSNNMNHKLQELDKELCGIQQLNKNVEDHGNNLHMHISEAHSKFAHISQELHCMNQQDVAESTNPFLQGEDTITPAVNRVGTMGKTEGKEDVHDRSLQVDNGEEDHTKLEDHSILDHLSAKEKVTNHQDADEKQDSLQKEDNVLNDETQDQANDQEDQPNWQQLFLDGMEDREKILLVEYTTTLRNYKEIKRKLLEIEKKKQDSLTETTQQLSKLESANAMKDEEIRSLRLKLKLIPTSSDKNSNKSTDSASSQMPGLQEEGSVSKDENVAPNSRADGLSGAAETPTEQDEEITVMVKDEPRNPSGVEEKFRKDIDGLLEENLKFWLRFSTSFHHIQKFQTAVEDLGAEYSMVKGKKKQDDNTSTDDASTTDRTSIDHTTTKDQPLKSAVRPIYDHLSEIQKEIKDWLEHNASFKGELQCRLSSLSKIQEEISTVSKEGSENEEVKFTSYQAAKFQGEVLNMQQENNKVAEELEAGLEHVKAIEIEIKKLLVQLSKDLGFSGSKSIEDVEHRESNVERTESMSNGDLRSPGSSNRRAELRHSETKTQVPLRSFLFGGTKPKKHKPKLFTLIHPALHRQSKS